MRIVLTMRYSTLVALDNDDDDDDAAAIAADDDKKRCGWLLRLPAELVQILLAFLAPCIAPLLRVSRAIWLRAKGDWQTWKRSVAVLRASGVKARARLRPHAPKLLAQFPSLALVMPESLADDAPCFALSPDGRLVACCSKDGLLRVLSLVLDNNNNNAPIATLSGKPSSQLCFSPSGAVLACMDHAHIALVDCGTWMCAQSLLRQSWVWTTLGFLPDDAVVAGSLQGDVVVWSSSDNAQPHVLSNVWSVHALAVSPEFIACGLRNGHVALWPHAGSGVGDTAARHLVGHHRAVREVCFIDADHAATASDDATVRVWLLADGACTHVIRFGVDVNEFGGGLGSVAACGSRLAVSLFTANKIRLFEVGDAEAVEVGSVAVDGPFRIRFASRDGNTLVFSSLHGELSRMPTAACFETQCVSRRDGTHSKVS